MKLSEHFDLSEFTRSGTAARMGIDMTASDAVLANLRRLCAEVLEPIRKRVGPIIVTSGYRPDALNRAVGGSHKSDHLHGLAADIVPVSVSLQKLAESVQSMQDRMPLKQGIVEFGQWLHVSVQPVDEAPKREFLTASRERGMTVYSSGLRFT